MTVYRVRLNDLGRRVFPKKNPNRLGDWLGEAVLRYDPRIWQCPRWRVHWDGAKRPSTIVKTYVEFDGDMPEKARNG